MFDDANESAEIAAREAIHRLMRAAMLRDADTGLHFFRVGHYAAIVAETLGLSVDEQRCILHAAPMHDIGKIAIPDSLLQKRGPLTPAEMDVMRSHTAVGHHILNGSRSKLLEMAAEIALGHHEKFDGCGYPHGIAGHAIPLSARICAITDAFDALTSERPYRSAWSTDAAIAMIRAQAGSAFDPTLVDVFVESRDRITAIKEQFTGLAHLPQPSETPCNHL